MEKYRKEKDNFGVREIPARALYGIHSLRARENFPLSSRPVHPAIIRAYGAVNLAYARTNMELGAWPVEKYSAIESACVEMMEGGLDGEIIVAGLHGGEAALCMNIAEVIANRAIVLLGGNPGDYRVLSPGGDIQPLHSRGEAYPLAVKTAIVSLLRALESDLAALVDSLRTRGMTDDSEVFSSCKWSVHNIEPDFRSHPLFYSSREEISPEARRFVLRAGFHLKDITGYEITRDENISARGGNSHVYIAACDVLENCASELLRVASAFYSGVTAPGSASAHAYELQNISGAAAQAAVSSMGDIFAVRAACSINLSWNGLMLPVIADSLLFFVNLLSHACRLLRKSCAGRPMMISD